MPDPRAGSRVRFTSQHACNPGLPKASARSASTAPSQPESQRNHPNTSEGQKAEKACLVGEAFSQLPEVVVGVQLLNGLALSFLVFEGSGEGAAERRSFAWLLGECMAYDLLNERGHGRTILCHKINSKCNLSVPGSWHQNHPFRTRNPWLCVKDPGEIEAPPKISSIPGSEQKRILQDADRWCVC